MDRLTWRLTAAAAASAFTAILDMEVLIVLSGWALVVLVVGESFGTAS